MLLLTEDDLGILQIKTGKLESPASKTAHGLINFYSTMINKSLSCGISEVYSKSSQTSRMAPFAKITNDF